MSTFSNSVQLIGHLGQDVEVKSLDNGSKVGKVSIATNEYFKTPDGDKQTKTMWHRLVAWGVIAERMQLTLQKGSYVAIKGKLTYSDFEAKDGSRKYLTEISVSEFHLLEKSKKLKEAS